jgi:2-keto-4-pentenoate hydratase/2-oxohepta-3-ene-1,7-dioic acid hydratase in catechol pathway
LTAAIGLGPELLERAATTFASADDTAYLPLDSVVWLPAADPPVLRDAMAFEEHLQRAFGRSGLKIPDLYWEIPAYYKGSQAGLIGHNAEVAWPAYTRIMDYELELGFVVGPGGRNLQPEEAQHHLFGVTIYADFSARDIQLREMTLQLGPAKGKDFATALGPWVTTADELNVLDLGMVARVNGEEWSRGSSGTITWTPAELLAYVSYGENLLAGDVIGSGTVGNGCGLELGRRLSPGDVVEMEIDGVGVLRNTLGQPEQAGWNPVPRTRKDSVSA